MSDSASTPKTEHPDALRRKITKGGLAVPVVLATLTSKQVLGAAHNCTVSGQVSGNVSTHAQGDCKTLGVSVSGWSVLSEWYPCSYFFSTCPGASAATAYLFMNTPAKSDWPKFVDAYLKNGTSKPTVVEVMNGTTTRPAVTITPKARASVELGQEAIAALLSSLRATKGYPTYPVSAVDVVEMFNAIASAGVYNTEFGERWYHDDVLNYFKMLHY